jgi:hypothetical protein
MLFKRRITTYGFSGQKMSVSWWISAILILFALLTQNALSSNESHCVPYPIGIGIQNVTLGNNVARGVSLSVGTPKQPFAFLPQWYVPFPELYYNSPVV